MENRPGRDRYPPDKRQKVQVLLVVGIVLLYALYRLVG